MSADVSTASGFLMASYPAGATYHADSDADDEFERSVMTSPTHLNTDSETSSEAASNEHTPTTFGTPADDGKLPRTIISEWTAEECAQFISSLGLRQYEKTFLDNSITGDVLIALKHDDVKEMGVLSVGHRLKILKEVYEIKIRQDVPIDPDDYVPPSAEQDPHHDMATKDDIYRLTQAILRLRDDRIAQVEAQLTKLADDYRKLRLELLPVFKMAKDSAYPLPHRPYDTSMASPEYQQDTMISPPLATGDTEKQSKPSLTRTFSKKLGLTSSTPKNHSPTHLPSTIPEGRATHEPVGLAPSAAATQASNTLTAQMSGGSLSHNHHSPNPGSVPSPTSPIPFHQPLAPRSYQATHIHPEDPMSRTNSTPPMTTHDPPKSAGTKTSTLSNASTLIPSREMSQSVPPQLSTRADRSANPASASSTEADAPSVQIFKSFRVALDDPCYKILPAALRKYNKQADWRQYALYIVYGDQERCVGLEEKPLALFKDLERENKKPMFMLRKLANGVADGASVGLGTPMSALGVRPGTSLGERSGVASSAASVRTVQSTTLPGGML